MSALRLSVYLRRLPVYLAPHGNWLAGVVLAHPDTQHDPQPTTHAPFQAALPFETKPKVATKRKNVKQGYLRKRAVVLEPEERRKRFLLQALATIRNDKMSKAKARRTEKLAARDKAAAREQAKFALPTKLEKQRKYREMGKADAARKRKRGAA